MEYKKGDNVNFIYGRDKEKKTGIISDVTSKGYVVHSGFSQMSVEPNEITGLAKEEPKKKLFGIFKEGGNLDNRKQMYVGEVGESKLASGKKGFVSEFDGKKRFEISDENMEVLMPIESLKTVVGNGGTKTFTLSEFIKHDLLFKAYPEFKKIPINFINDKESNIGVFVTRWNKNENILMLISNLYNYDRDTVSVRRNRLALRGLGRERTFESIIVHELQHIIQIREGFGGGSSIMQERSAILQKNKIDWGKIGEDEKDFIMVEAKKNFFRHLGEIESKDVESRLDLTDEERLNKEPLSGFEFNKNNVIVKHTNGLDWDNLNAKKMALGGNIENNFNYSIGGL